VAAILRLFHLGHQSLWIDEMFTWLSSGGGGPLTLRDVLEDVHGPLYSAAVHVATRLGGATEWALRLPSAIAGVLTVPAFAWLAARWLDRRAVAPAAWLAACSPFLVWYSQEARNYAWLMLGTCVSGAALLELQRHCDARNVARYFAAAVAALLSNLSFLLLAPLHLRWWLAGEPSTRRARIAWLAGVTVAIALIALPWLPQVARTWDWRRLQPEHAAAADETPLRGATTFHAAAMPFALHAFAVGYTLGPSLRELRAHAGGGTLRRHAGELLATGLTFGVLGVLGLWSLARRRRLAETALWLVAPGLVVSYFALHNFKVFHPRYLIVSLPCFLLVVTAAFTDAPARLRWLLGAAVAALWGVSLAQHYFVPEYGREDYRGALAIVRAGFSPGEQVMAAGAEEPVEFYARGMRVEPFWLGFTTRPGRLEQKLQETFARAHGTWVVLSRAEDLDPEDRFASRLDASVPPSGRWSRPGVRVWHVAAGRENAENAAGVRRSTGAP